MSGISEWAARQQAGKKLNKDISHPQFRAYREWGIIGEPNDEGRWPEKVVDRLVQIHRLGEKTHCLPRRVILLKAEFQEFSIPAAKLKKAMIEILPTITSPTRKMRLINRGFLLLSYDMSEEAKQFTPPIKSDWRPPSPSQWEVLLKQGSDNFYNNDVALGYSTDGIMLYLVKAFEPDLCSQIEQIPYEERVTLSAVRRIALFLARGCPVDF